VASTNEGVILDAQSTTGYASLALQTASTDRINIASNGDVSLYEDTGTTAKLFWDASAESLGIGTASPSKTLDIRTNSSGEAAVLKISNEYTGGTAVASMEFGQTSGTAKASIAAAVYNDGFMAFRTNDNTEKMRIDAAGHVGIGTDSPTTGTSTYYDDLVIKNATSGTGAGITIQSNTSNGYGGLDFRKADGTQVSKIFASSADGAMGFETAGAERMRIDSSGNLLVGTTDSAPGAGDTNTGVSFRSGGDGFFSKASSYAARFNRNTSDGDVVTFAKDGTTVGSISVTGSSTTYNTSSDQRLKENIADADDAGSKVDAIQVRKFDWKADGSHQDYGMIAQELQAVAPEAVSGDADLEEMMGVDYSKLVPMLIKEIQQLRQRVAQLEE